jgi:hypothetical protein
MLIDTAVVGYVEVDDNFEYPAPFAAAASLGAQVVIPPPGGGTIKMNCSGSAYWNSRLTAIKVENLICPSCMP